MSTTWRNDLAKHKKKIKLTQLDMFSDLHFRKKPSKSWQCECGKWNMRGNKCIMCGLKRTR